MAEKKQCITNKQIRTFWLSSRITDLEGKTLLTEEIIQKAIRDHITVESWAYIKHDQDTITKYDKEVDEENHAWGNIGDKKPEHFHVVISLKSPVKVGNIAKWFGLGENMINFQKGRNGSRDPYLDNVAYLTHEFEPSVKEKHIYSRDEVKLGGLRVDIWEDIDRVYGNKERHKKYRINSDDLNDIIDDVATKGLTLKKAREIVGEVVYLRNETLFKKARQNYVLNVQPMPALRTVFYVECVNKENKDIGKGGVGKTVCTHALAKQFSKEFGADVIKPYEELVREGYIFDIGGEGVALQNYDGQPILVMNEMDSYSMFKTFGRRGTKELLDNFPTRQDQNIKYGSTVITAKYIIINGIERYDKFIQGLGGIFGEMNEADKDLTQYYRRFFAHITLVDEEYMDIFFTKCHLDNTRECREYYAIKNVYAPFKKMLTQMDNVVVTDLQGNVLRPLVDKSKEREQSILTEKKGYDSEEYREMAERIKQNQAELKLEDDHGFVSVDDDEPLPFD